MSAPLFCTRCTAPLDAPSATGLCARCVTAPDPTGAPPARPQQERAETPSGAGDGTPAGDAPNPFAPTATGPFEVLTADPPPGAAPRPLPLSPAGYQIIGWLGDGGMGYVYSALELASNRLVALKFMRHPNDPGLFGRFVDEFGVLANLEHPHVVRVFGHDFHRADPFFTMELMDGGALADRLRNGPLAAADAVELIRKVAAGVQALHGLRCYGNLNGPVIHRDIKPRNILLTATGEPKLADFGLVKYLGASAVHTVPGDIVGTAQYMPPEQINRANGALDVRADVYGLGATLYHLLTGYAPFTGEEAPEILHSVLVDPPVRPRVLRPEITRGLESVVLKCLEKDPRDRYQSVAEFVAALDLWAARDVPEPRPLWQRVRRWVRDHKRAVAAVALALALVGVWGMVPGPVAPLVRIRDEIKDDGRAEIFDRTGKPRHKVWLAGTASVLEPRPDDPAFAFEAPQPALLELMNKPGTHVALEGEFRLLYHKAIVNGAGPPKEVGFGDAAMFGLFCGHTVLQGPNGQKVHLVLVAEYTDFLTRELRAQLPVASGSARFVWVAVSTDPNGETGSQISSAGKQLPITLADKLPAPFRRLRVEMSAAGAKAYWSEGPTGDLVPVGTRSNAEIANDLAKLIKDRPGFQPVVPPVWNPEASSGVFCRGAAVAVKNVRVVSLP